MEMQHKRGIFGPIGNCKTTKNSAKNEYPAMKIYENQKADLSE